MRPPALRATTRQRDAALKVELGFEGYEVSAGTATRHGLALDLENRNQLLVRLTTQNLEEYIRARREGRTPTYLD